jgi:cyclopropane fatty-acyl-phospholipid synthase-like methyltransferase
MNHFLRIYSKQEYLTPGAAETVERIYDVAKPDEGSLLLDVACGKGEAMCTLAERSGCRVVGVDLWPIFFPHVRRKIEQRGVRPNVRLVRADGKRLPARESTFDAAYCIGAPSIVGLEDCIREMARTVKPGGPVVVSDIVWREKPVAPLGPEWKWIATVVQQITMEEYVSVIESAGLQIEETSLVPTSAWDAYHEGMLEVAREARESGDEAFADENDSNIEMENRAVEQFFDYAMFVARKPGR